MSNPTRRQQEIARLYALGYRAEDVAAQLGIPSVRTVYQHAHDARKRGADVPKLARGAPARSVDYLTYVRDFRAGLTVTEIAAKHGVVPSTVSRALLIMREAGATIEKPKVGGRRPGAFGKREG